MTVLEEARHELKLRQNNLADLLDRRFMAEVKRDKDALDLKISEARITIRQQEQVIARLERVGRN